MPMDLKSSRPIHAKLDISKPSQQQKNKVTKKEVICFKCGKLGYKAFQCKTGKKIIGHFANDPNLQKKLLLVLAKNSSEEKDDYYLRTDE